MNEKYVLRTLINQLINQFRYICTFGAVKRLALSVP